MLQSRSAGILLPIFSLPTEYGIGDIGPVAERWIDQLAAAGLRYWQVLPFHPVHANFQYSPYSGLSAFAGSVLLLSPERLLVDGWLDQLPEPPETTGGTVAYAEAETYKVQLVRRAFEALKPGSEADRAFRVFASEEADWLDAYACFCVAAERQGTIDWPEWPRKWRDFQRVFNQLKAEDPEALDRQRFGQFLFFEQWRQLRSYAHKRAVHLIGDIPIYVHHDSADVWAHPHLFKLLKNGKAKKVAGVPPDYFSEDGQLWGNPVYDWDRHEASDFDWWVRRLRHEVNCFDLVRIDHFLGLVQYYEIDAKADTAKNGKYRKAPKEAFFKTLRRHFPSMPFLAEDLGSVTAEATLTMNRFGLPGMRVLHFAFGDPTANGNPYLPHNYPLNVVAYSGTHDNNTSRGWWQSDLKEAGRKHVQRYLGKNVDDTTIAGALLHLLWQSPAGLVIAPYQDVLNLDGAARLNRPGTIEHNWEWTVPVAQLEGPHWEQLREWTTLFGR